MSSLRQFLSNIFTEAFERCGLPGTLGQVSVSQRPDLGQFQNNGALAAGKTAGKNPFELAQEIAHDLEHSEVFSLISVAPPGFINVKVSDPFIASFIEEFLNDPRLGCPRVMSPRNVVMDFGGPNVAKAMHVGHLRSSIIGDALQRLYTFMGDNVISDIHLGDWGLPMGMLISELKRRQPNHLPYFDDSYCGAFPRNPPVTVTDLEEMYVTAAGRCDSDGDFLREAQKATVELQRGRPGHRALWRQFVAVSVAALRRDFEALGITFKLWYGESRYQERISTIIERLRSKGYAVWSEGALVIPVMEEGDDESTPPFMLMKADGGFLYGTTDLATLDERIHDLNANAIFYIVDKRQSLHFRQLFRAARKTGLGGNSELQHVAFGTMNDLDGKPFKTRAGGVMKLVDLIAMVTDAALNRMAQAELAISASEDDRLRIARQVGLAALKFGDLMHERTMDYVFDLDRFTRFEGRTGPYLQYTGVRIRSIFHKSGFEYNAQGAILPPVGSAERDLMLTLSELPDSVLKAYEQRAPHFLCDFAYRLAQDFNRFYHQCHILSESDPERKISWLKLSQLSLRQLEFLASLLGIEIPTEM
jgi:arginyl-tRNA synthetase